MTYGWSSQERLFLVLGAWQGSVEAWFCRDAFSDYGQFEAFLESVHVWGRDDRPRWTLDGSGKFRVRSFYHKLFASKFGDGNTGFRWRLVRQSRAPSIVFFLLWEGAFGRALTIDNLLKKGDDSS